jgi:transglutaminase-like putative cysteine protease
MRFRIALSFALSVAALQTPAFLHAQFQQPTKEELEMTQDPKAPGAAAVYLYREETVDDTLHYHTYYERVKILTEKGKELATVHYPYERGSFKVTNIEGRTIHPDGTVIPLTAKPSDLVDEKAAGFQINSMVFTLPNVEVGSILEYRLNIRYDDSIVSSPNWTVQQTYFVHKAHYFFTPPTLGYISNSRGDNLNRLMYSVHADGKTTVVRDARGRYTFDITDVPPIPTEDWMPPLNSMIWGVKFYYTQYYSGPEFWQGEGKRWAKEAEKFANPTKLLQQAAAGIVAANDTDEQKARKLYAAVMQLDNTSFSRQKSEAERKKEKLKAIKDAEDVWNQKSGSSDDLALLYVALAKAAGLQAYPMEVVDRNRAVFDPDYLSINQLDDYLAIVVLGGKDVYLDPGQKDCPFGLLHWKHSYSAGLRLSATGVVPAETPSSTYQQSAVTRVADINIDADSNITGTVRFIMTGSEALHWRQLQLENDPEEVKKQFNESIRAYIPDGVQADFDHFLGLEDYSTNLIGFVKVSGNMGSATGKRFFLPGLFFESRAKHPFVAEDKRLIPIDVRYPKLEQDDVTYHLPPGYSVESAPQATSLSWPNHALMKVTSNATGTTVNIQRVMAYNYTLLDAKEYNGLHDFYQKVASADQQQLVLTRSPVVAKGN